MIRTAGEPKRSGGGPSVVSGETQACQDAGQKRKALLIGDLPAPYIGATGVLRLILNEAFRKTRVMHIVGLDDGVGITNILVEETGGKQAERLQILLEEEVIIIGKCGFQIGIAFAAVVPPPGLARYRQRQVWRQIAKLRPSDSP